MENKVHIKVPEIVSQFGIEIINDDCEFNDITKSAVTRTGLALAGFFSEDAIKGAVIAWSNQETVFFSEHEWSVVEQRIIKIFSYRPSLLLLSKGMKESYRDLIIELAKKYFIPVANTFMTVAEILGSVGVYLQNKFAKNYQIHGTLVVIHGFGVLITGNSGVGKSEAALELVQRGHVLISDDAVIVRQFGNRIIGTSPEITKHILEARGIGLIDINEMYGYTSVADEHQIDLVVNLLKDTPDYEFDRLGDKNLSYQIYNAKIPLIQLPIRSGRSVASLIEAATSSQILRNHGKIVLNKINDRTIRKD